MTRAVVFLTATLLFASLGLVAQNSQNGEQGASAQTAAPASSSAQTGAPATSRRADTRQRTTTAPATKGIQQSAQGEEPRTANSRAELPQTSTILPLLGLLGLGSLVAGLFARR
jgi:hypothetical protein